MSLPRVDVCDSTDEGASIVAALRGRSLLVTEVTAADLAQGSDASLVVLAAEADGAIELLATLRVDATSVTPVVLLGSPPGRVPLDRASALALGADDWLARPVPVERLVRKVETFLAPVDGRLHTVPAPVADPPVGPSFVPPSLTMRLDDRESERPSSQVVPLSTGVHDVRPRPLDDPPPETQRPGISAALRELLSRADRRSFPDESPLDVNLAVGDEPPEALVPAGVLDDAEDEMSAQGALDALEPSPSSVTPGPIFATGIHAGTPSPTRTPASRGESELPPVTTSAARKSALPPERRSALPTRSRGSARPSSIDEDIPGEATSGGRGRAGTLGPAGGLALLFRVADKRLDVRVRIEAPGASLTLGVRHGDVRSVDGPIAERALTRLGIAEQVRGEDEALAALDRRVAAAVISSFAKERALARAREELLGDVACAKAGRFEIAALDAGTSPTTSAGGGGPRPFRSGLAALLVEVARARLDVPFVKKLLGAESVRLVPTPRSDDVFARCAIAPELVQLFSTREGMTLDTLLAETAGEPGVAGLAYALVAAGALTATALAPGKDLGAAATTRMRHDVREAAARAEESDYFAILGVPHDAGGDAVRAAHAALSRSLAALPLTDLGQPELEPLRALALDALDEALSVLGDDSLRARYAAALV